MACAPLLTSSRSSSGETSRAAMTSSSSRRLMAMMPPDRGVLEGGQLGLLHQPAAGGQHQVRRHLVVAQREHLGDPLVGLEREQVGHVLAAGVAAGVGQLVGLGPVDPALVGEEQDPVVRRGDEEVVHDVVGAQLRAADALAAAPLGPVQVGLGPLGVAAVGDGDRDVLFGDEVLVGHLAVVGDDLGPPLVPVLGDDLGQLRAHDLALPLRRGQDATRSRRSWLRARRARRSSSWRSRAASLRSCMSRIARAWISSISSSADQALLGLGGRRAGPDQRDDLVDPVDGLEQRGHDVQPLGGLAQPELGAPDDDLDLVRHPVADHLVQAQGARHPVDQGQHVGAERVLQLGVLVQVVEHDLGDRVPLEHDDQPLAGAPAALVLHAGDPVDPAVPDQLGDLLGQVVPVDLERQLLDDQAGPAAGVLLHLDDGAHGDRAAPGPVGVPDAAPAHDQAAGSGSPAPGSAPSARRAVPRRRRRSGPGTTARRPRPRAGCAAGSWSPCRPRSRRTR